MTQQSYTVRHRGVRCEIALSCEDGTFWCFTVEYFGPDGRPLENDSYGTLGHIEKAEALRLAVAFCARVVNVNIDGHRRVRWANAVLLTLQDKRDQLLREARARRTDGDIIGADRLELDSSHLNDEIDVAWNAYDRAQKEGTTGGRAAVRPRRQSQDELRGEHV